MTRALIDTNILVDLFTLRAPFGADAQALWQRVTRGQLTPAVSAVSVTTVFYLLEKLINAATAYQAIVDLLRDCEIVPVDRGTLAMALQRSWPDFEDAVQDAAAESAGIPIIVTRDPHGFAGSTRRIVDAPTLVQELDQSIPPGP